MSEQASIFDFVPNPYHKAEAMPTEIASAEEILKSADPRKPMKPGGAGHRVLLVFISGNAMTAYEASKWVCGDYHGKRRECRRLYERGYLELLSWTMPNPAPEGRRSVEAWRITEAGLNYLREHAR